MEPLPTHPASLIPAPVRQTLVFIFRGDQVLLGFKKRGFAANTWNGYGGKALFNETPAACAVRELQEESSLKIAQTDLVYVGVLHIKQGGSVQDDRDVYLYTVDYKKVKNIGEPRETGEMKPQWFDLSAIPYEAMLPVATKWLPDLIKGRKFDITVWKDSKEDDDVKYMCIYN